MPFANTYRFLIYALSFLFQYSSDGCSVLCQPPTYFISYGNIIFNLRLFGLRILFQ
jgi:hypothetical protein